MEQNKRPLIINGEAVGEIELCPECGTPLKVWHTPNGDSDYNVEAECPGCGETFTE